MIREPIFLDSWAWIAIVDKHDPYHAVVTDAFEQMRQRRTYIVTTNVVVYEAYENLRRRLGLPIAICFRDIMGACRFYDAFTLTYVRQEDEDEAMRLAERYPDQDFSLTDCFSFVIMKRLNLRTAFTGDKHLMTAGFNIIPNIPR
jgi:hypothetical protein